MYRYIFLVFAIFIFKNITAQHSPEELAYINEINLIRTNPKAYIQYVKAYANSTRFAPEREIAIKELIPLLDSMKPLPEYKISEEVRKEANKHLADSTKRDMDHDRTYSWLKIPCKSIGENITYGTSIRASILIALIDYSSQSRGHRSNILNPNLTHTSVRKVNLGNTNNRGDLLMGKARVIWLQNFIKF